MSLFSCKVSRHDEHQVEIKHLLQGSACFEAGVKLTCTLSAPTILGSVEKELFLANTWSLNRCGFGHQIRLVSILDDWENWRQVLFDSIRLLSPDSNAYPELNDLNSYEHEIRVLGCLMKSALRDEVKAITATVTEDSSIEDGRKLLGRFKQIPKLLDTLRTDIGRASGSNQVAFLLVNRLEEFILNQMETQCAKLASKVSKLEPLYTLACEISMTCNKRIRERKYASQWEVESGNELYTQRKKDLKYYFLSVLYLGTKVESRSLAFTDLVGMIAAAIAMAVSLVIFWHAEANHDRFSVPLLLILVFAYVLKDRIKEWGKRYVIPVLKVPFRSTTLKIIHGARNRELSAKVGKVREWLSIGEVRKSQYDLYEQSPSNLHREREIESVPLARPRSVTSIKYSRHIKLYESEWRTHARLKFFNNVGVDQLYRNHMNCVQVTRINLAGIFSSRMNSLRLQESVIDPRLHTPITLNCREVYTVHLTVRHDRASLTRFSYRNLLKLFVSRSRIDDESNSEEPPDRRVCSTTHMYNIEISKEGIERITEVFAESTGDELASS